MARNSQTRGDPYFELCHFVEQIATYGQVVGGHGLFNPMLLYNMIILLLNEVFDMNRTKYLRIYS